MNICQVSVATDKSGTEATIAPALTKNRIRMSLGFGDGELEERRPWEPIMFAMDYNCYRISKGIS